MQKMKKFFYMPLIAVALAACGGENKTASTEQQASPTVAASDNLPTVRVALEPVYPPFVQQLPEGGYEGFDVSLLNEIGKRQGFKVNYTPHVWSGIFDYLNKGEVDVVIGGVAISEERKSTVDFSDSYLSNPVVFVVKEDSPYTTVEQLNGKKIAYQLNTFSADELSKMHNGKLEKSLGETSAWKTLQRVIMNDGQADAAIGDTITTHYYMAQYKDQHLRTITAANLPSENVAFAVKKGNTALLDKLNKGLAEVKADGTFAKLEKEWLEAGHDHAEHIKKEEHQHKH